MSKSRPHRVQELPPQEVGARTFFFAYGTWVGIAAFVLATASSYLFSAYRENSIAKEGARLNQHLENVEKELRFAMRAGDREKALDLVDQLSHPLHERWKDGSKWDKWHGYPYYSDWWSAKREQYKEQIMALPSHHAPSAYPSTAHVEGKDQGSSAPLTNEKRH